MVVDNGCPETAAATAIAPPPPSPRPLYICYESSRDEYGSDADFHHPATTTEVERLGDWPLIGVLASWAGGEGRGKQDLCSDGSCKGQKTPAVQAGAAQAGSGASYSVIFHLYLNIRYHSNDTHGEPGQYSNVPIPSPWPLAIANTEDRQKLCKHRCVRGLNYPPFWSFVRIWFLILNQVGIVYEVTHNQMFS